MALVDQLTPGIGEELLQVDADDATLPAVAPEVPVQHLLEAPEGKVQPHALTAGVVVIDQAGGVEGHQHLLAEGFVDLAIRNVWGIYRARLAPLPEDKVRASSKSMLSQQYPTPPAGGTRE